MKNFLSNKSSCHKVDQHNKQLEPGVRYSKERRNWNGISSCIEIICNMKEILKIGLMHCNCANLISLLSFC